jgi:hypothetical protein
MPLTDAFEIIRAEVRACSFNGLSVILADASTDTGWIDSQVKIVKSDNVAGGCYLLGVATTMGLLILACNKAQFLFGGEE